MACVAMTPLLEEAYFKLASARLLVKERAKYMSPMVLALVPHPIPGFKTMGVSRDLVLAFDPEVVAHQWTIEEIAGALVHESFHPWMHHLERMDEHIQNGITVDPDLWNKNADRTINPIVRDMKFQLPFAANACWPAQLNMKEGLTVEEYYAAEQKEKKAGRDPSPEPKGPGSGKCGGIAGNPNPGEPNPQSDEQNEGKEEGASDRPRGRSEAEIERTISRMAEMADEHAKGQGALPAGLDRLVKATLAPPKVSWRRRLETVARHAITYRDGAVVPRFTGINRKQAGIGFGPGKPVLPVWFQPVPRVAVGTDTSGSMSQHDLEVCLIETNGIMRALGAEITFVVFDAAVHGLKVVKGIKEAVAMLKGGGGSDCRPAFEALRKMPAHKRPEIVVIQTDGWLSVPVQEPREFKTIWLLIGKQSRPPCTWGTAIKVEE